MNRLVLGITTMVCAAFLLAGCDDDGNAFSLDAYFEEVEGLVEDYEADSNEAFATFNESNDLEELKDAFESMSDSLDSFLDGMNALAPPDEAADAHDEAVEAGEAVLDATEDVNDDVQAAETIDALRQAAGNDELFNLTAEFNATCQPLQDIATENDVDVDLSCPAQ